MSLARCAAAAPAARAKRRAVLRGGAAALVAVVPVLPARAREVTLAIDAGSIAVNDCGAAAGVPGTSTFKAKCVELVGTVQNPSSTLYNADVYGLIKDAAADPVLRSGRVGTLDVVPPGESEFRLQITAAASQPFPFKLKNFKAVGNTAVKRVSGNPYDLDYESSAFPGEE